MSLTSSPDNNGDKIRCKVWAVCKQLDGYQVEPARHYNMNVVRDKKLLFDCLRWH